MSKEIKKGNPESKPIVIKELPNLSERSWHGSANNLEKGESRKPVMSTAIPTPPKKKD